MVKIICAGFQKTGTKSLSRALEYLGYNGKLKYNLTKDRGPDRATENFLKFFY